MTLRELCKEFRKDTIMRVLYENSGHRLKTAKALGITMKHLGCELAELRREQRHDPAGLLTPQPGKSAP